MITVRQDYLPFGKPNFGEEEVAAVTKVLQSGWVGMGPEVISFEEDLKAYLQVPEVVTVSSCTAAMFLSLLTLGVQSGDEVICPSLTWCSTANVALYLGAKPVFCDIDPHSLCVTPELVREKLSSRTKAVMVVHFGGLAADIDAIRAELPDSVAIIEDAAHAFGAKLRNGAPVGRSGNLTCFSFYANKNLSTGEGGAVALFDPLAADRIRSLRQHGMSIDAWKRYSHPVKAPTVSGLNDLGYKMNYTDLQACIGRVQLKRQSELQAVRLDIACYYYNRLSQFTGLTFQASVIHPHHARHLFIIKLPLRGESRDRLLLKLREHNVGASVHYLPLHLMPLYNVKGLELPNTERVSSQIMTLPISASMTLDDARYVVDQVQEFLESELYAM